jgi:restriction system protein
MARRGSPSKRGGKRRGTVWPAVLGAVVLLAFMALDGSTWAVLLAVVALLAVLAAAGALVIRRMGAAYRDDALRRAGLDRLDHKRFEELAAELLRRDGFRRVRVVGGAGDRGVDVVGVACDGRPYAVQCKYYTRPVGATSSARCKPGRTGTIRGCWSRRTRLRRRRSVRRETRNWSSSIAIGWPTG